MEAGQAGFAFCVVVTVALANVAFASATPTTTSILKNNCRRTGHGECLPTSTAVEIGVAVCQHTPAGWAKAATATEAVATATAGLVAAGSARAAAATAREA
eukprot:scaffold143450_cov169-Phaeocystis_antarctica.AAC.1